MYCESILEVIFLTSSLRETFIYFKAIITKKDQVEFPPQELDQDNQLKLPTQTFAYIMEMME